MDSFLMLCACGLFLLGWFLYNRELLVCKKSSPITAWSLFSFIVLLNGLTYLKMGHNWINTLLIFTDCFTCVTTVLVLVLRKNRDLSISEAEKWAIVLGLVSIVIWKVFSARYGNWFVQIPYTIAFYPIFQNAWSKPEKEPTKPWFIWGAAFGLMLLVVILDPESTGSAYVSPVACLIYHIGTGILSLHKKQAITVQG